MNTILILELSEGLNHPIKLAQNAKGRFRVTYGLQVTDNLNYDDAAHEFGECVFHSLTCTGALVIVPEMEKQT